MATPASLKNECGPEQLYNAVLSVRELAYLSLSSIYKQAKNPEPERRAYEIRLRAERKAGELLKEMDKQAGARGLGSNQHQKVELSSTAPPTLKDMGITKDQSSRWQQLANIPEAQFEQALAAPEKPSTNGIIRQHKEPQQEPMNPKALWLWGRLRDNRIDDRGQCSELAPGGPVSGLSWLPDRGR